MINDGAGAVLPGAMTRIRVAARTRRWRAVWRSLTWTRSAWTFGLGAIGGLLFLISHSMHRVQSLVMHEVSVGNTIWECAVAIGITIVVAFLFLLALSFAEYGDRGQPRAWMRYVIATLAAVGGATAIEHVISPHVPIAGLIGWYGLETQTSIDSFVFSNWLLFGGLAVFVYVRLGRARRTQHAFERAELQRMATRREMLTAQLAAAQAQVEPGFLFNTLHQVEAQYEHDSASGDRVLEDLIDYLRAALPQLRGEESTLARESALADAYLRIVQGRMGSRLEFTFDIPHSLGARHFPPMLLLPLIENAVRDGLEPLPHGGRLEICATSVADRMRVTVSDNGLRDVNELLGSPGLDTVRERLADLYGAAATLAVIANQPCGATAIVEVPFA